MHNNYTKILHFLITDFIIILCIAYERKKYFKFLRSLFGNYENNTFLVRKQQKNKKLIFLKLRKKKTE